jgi:K+-transporting ATPase KdpF subunit
MSALHVVAALIVTALLIYLLVAMLWPERIG